MTQENTAAPLQISAPQPIPSPGEFFPPERAAHYREQGWWTEVTFASFLPELAARYAEQPAAVARDTAGEWHHLSYTQLDQQAGLAAAYLQSQGIKTGDRVVLHLPNQVEFLWAFFGLVRLGAIPVMGVPAHGRVELAHFLGASDAVALITAQPKLAEELTAAFSEQGRSFRTILTQDLLDSVTSSADATAPTPLPSPAGVHPEGLGLLQVSGGTTNVPKLIPRTHADYLYSIRQAAEVCEVNTDTRFLVAIPVAHNFTMSSPGILGVLHRGGTVVLAPDPSPSTVFPLVEKEKVTMTSAVPPLALTWLTFKPKIKADTSSLRVLQVGGAKFTAEAARRVRPELGCQLQQVFGMAEGLVNYTAYDDAEELITGTQGRPMSPGDEVRVVDDAGQPVAAGEPGNLQTRGPYTITAYLGNVDADSFTSDGFYFSGDVVRQLPSGHLVVEGRSKDQINRGGEKISAEEVEDHLLAHPLVHDAALVAIPDKFLGERACAFIQLEDAVANATGQGDAHSSSGDNNSTKEGGGQAETQLTAAELKTFLKKRGLANYKIPDRFTFVAEFPQTGIGKTSRKDLRRALAKTIAGE